MLAIVCYQVKQAIKFLDDLGTVQYFDNDFLRDKVVINPQWIVNVMACVVSVKQSPIQVTSLVIVSSTYHQSCLVLISAKIQLGSILGLVTIFTESWDSPS